jgi:hypothetical protein
MAGDFDVARMHGGGKDLERVIRSLDPKKDTVFAGGLLGGLVHDIQGNGKQFNPPLTRDNFVKTAKYVCDETAKPNRSIACQNDATKWVDHLLKKFKY